MMRAMTICCVLAMLSAGASIAQTDAAQTPPQETPAQQTTPKQTLQPYIIGPSDQLEITVVGETDPNLVTRVDETGTILAPLIGPITMSGLTFSQAIDALKAAYVDGGYLNDPMVAISLLEGRPYIVSGDVTAPGSYPARANLTVEEVIALAGGRRIGGGFNALDFAGANLRERLLTAWTDLFEAELGIARRRAEIAFSDEITMPDLSGNPFGQGFIETRLADETLILKTSIRDYLRGLADLRQQQAVTEEEIESTKFLRQQFGESIEMLRDALSEAEDLVEKGLQTRNRLVESRQRLAGAIAGLGAQTINEGQAQRRLIEIESQLARLESTRRAELLTQIGTLQAKLPPRRASLSSIDADAALAASLASGDPDSLLKTGFTIRRGPPGSKKTIAALRDTQVLPGDLLIVAVDFSPYSN